jgi:hypothetical protein
VTSTSRCVEIGRTSSEFGKPRPESISCLTGGAQIQSALLGLLVLIKRLQGHAQGVGFGDVELPAVSTQRRKGDLSQLILISH